MRAPSISLLTIALMVTTAATARAQEWEPVAEVDPLSTSPFKCYKSGSGEGLMRICISDHGNIVKFESPEGFDQIGQGNLFRDGYAICTGSLPSIPNESHGYDTGAIEAGFGPATVTDLSPLTIVRDTTNGVFRMTQEFKRDSKEKDVTIEVTVQNLSGVDRPAVRLQRAFEGDIDNNSTTNMWFGRTFDSAFAWVDQPAAGSPANGNGLMLTAVTTTFDVATAVNTVADYHPTGSGSRTANGCIVFAGGLATPASGAHNLVGRVLYGLGTIPAGGSKAAVFKYARF
jgi:hypothetical protein